MAPTDTANFDPRSPCGERPQRPDISPSGIVISIHAPLAGSDHVLRHDTPNSARFRSTLPLRGATRLFEAYPLHSLFRSTLPLRGATRLPQGSTRTLLISIHAPLAGSDGPDIVHLVRYLISIHAPLAGSDFTYQPVGMFHVISIHAPLAGSDTPSAASRGTRAHFDPRSPCGERPPTIRLRLRNGLFRSTLPLRGATATVRGIPLTRPISIHAPLAGSDAWIQPDIRIRLDFDPRSPCGERLRKWTTSFQKRN